MSKKLLEVKVAHIEEMEAKLQENKMMLDAWTNHVNCMQMERDDALERLKRLEKGASVSKNDNVMRGI